jgi:hypothetical protein
MDVVLINPPDIASSGAGETATRPLSAVIANAIFHGAIRGDTVRSWGDCFRDPSLKENSIASINRGA